MMSETTTVRQYGDWAIDHSF